MISMEWFGHSFWKIFTDDISIITDPFSDIGYSMPNDLHSDIVLSSHDHHDHNNFSLIQGDYKLVKKEGKYTIKGIDLELFPTWHDEDQGKKRGKNLLMKFSLEGKTLLHCGDLGHLPDESLLSRLGKIDILLLPVGGVFTIDAAKARLLCSSLEPQIIFPMHYGTPAVNFKLAPVTDFTGYYQRVIKYNNTEIQLTEDLFTGVKPAVILLNYA